MAVARLSTLLRKGSEIIRSVRFAGNLRVAEITAEESRLKESPDHTAPWRSWGPYVSERAWGTVREDYSATGEAVGIFSA